MVFVKTVRIWQNVQKAADSGRISSRLTMNIKNEDGSDVDWGLFDSVKPMLETYLQGFQTQNASEVARNQFALSLLKLLSSLIKNGFYTYSSIKSNLLGSLLRSAVSTCLVADPYVLLATSRARCSAS